MRSLLALGLALSTFAFSGCLGDGAAGASLSGAFGGPALDCSQASDQQAAQTSEVLLPSDAPGERPQVRIEVREGQTVAAVATWRATGGMAQAVFDGPSQHTVQTGSSWSSATTNVPAGTYTLSLEGAPLAAGVSYTLTLVAVGCTPA